MKKLLLILTSVFLYSCAPTISTTSMQNYSQLNPQDDVIVYREGETLPQDIKIIGKTEIGDSGFTIISFPISGFKIQEGVLNHLTLCTG